MENSRKVSKEQKKQIIAEAKETEILLDGYTAEFLVDGDEVHIYDTMNMIKISFPEFEHGLLVNDGNFTTKKRRKT